LWNVEPCVCPNGSGGVAMHNTVHLPGACSLFLAIMPPKGLIPPITTNLPPTMTKWHEYCTSPTFTIWDPLRDWFSSEGLDVFEVVGSTTVKPQVDELRGHDGTYSTHYAPPSIVDKHRVCEHRPLRYVCTNFVCRGQFIVLPGL
jgi:hypothetical protein